MFTEGLESLFIVAEHSPMNSFVMNTPLPPFTTMEGVTSISILSVHVIVKAGELTEGVPFFVRIAALESIQRYNHH